MNKENLIEWLSNQIDERMSLEEWDKQELGELLNEARQKEIIKDAYNQGIIDGLLKEVKFNVEINDYKPQRLRMLD